MDTTDSAYGDKLIRLDTFDTAVAVDPSAEDEAKRRFMTLILQTAHRNNGNIGHVLRATNTSGEVFAVKLLKDNAVLSGQAPDRSAEQSAAHLANTAALFEEYRHLCTVSHLRGFPRVYGYGSCEDDPLILMEWVEGTSLKQALPLLPHDASGGLTTQMVAAVGNAVLRALLMTQGLVNPVIHRDLSPANIMFRTTSRTLEQQIAIVPLTPASSTWAPRPWLSATTRSPGAPTSGALPRPHTPRPRCSRRISKASRPFAVRRQSMSMRFRAFCTSSTAVANRLTLSRRTPLQPARSIS